MNGGRRERDDAKMRQIDIAPERIGDEIDMVAELTECFDPMVFAERRTPRLEERLGRQHQYAWGRASRPVPPPRRVRSMFD